MGQPFSNTTEGFSKKPKRRGSIVFKSTSEVSSYIGSYIFFIISCGSRLSRLVGHPCYVWAGKRRSNPIAFKPHSRILYMIYDIITIHLHNTTIPCRRPHTTRNNNNNNNSTRYCFAANTDLHILYILHTGNEGGAGVKGLIRFRCEETICAITYTTRVYML